MVVMARIQTLRRLVLLNLLLMASPVLPGVRAGVVGTPVPQSDDLAEKSRRGKEAMAEGQYEEAILVFKDLVRALPDEAGLRMNLGLAYHMAGQHRRAMPELEAALTRQPKLAPALLFLGAARLQAGEPRLAVAPLEQLMEIDPDNTRALLMLADALLSSRQYDAAADRFRTLVHTDDANPTAWYGLGQSYEALSRSAFDSLQGLDAKSPYASLLLGRALLQQKRYARAFHLYRQAVSGVPHRRTVYEDLAEIYRNTGHPEWADEQQMKARQVPPADCRLQQAECLFEAGRYHQIVAETKGQQSPAALYWLSRAYAVLATDAFSHLRKLPSSAEMHIVSAESFAAQGRYREAAQEWRQALEYDPGNARARKQLAEALYLDRDFQAAKVLVHQLLNEETNSATLNMIYGDILLELYELEEAVSYLRKAVDLDPKLLHARASLGRAYLQSGRADQAIPHLTAALSDDEDGGIHYQLASAYKRTGQVTLADQTFKRYREIQASLEGSRDEQEQVVRITPPEPE